MTTILKYPLFVKGKNLPKNGVCLANAGEEVPVVIENSQTYVVVSYKGKQLKVATIVDTNN